MGKTLAIVFGILGSIFGMIGTVVGWCATDMLGMGHADQFAGVFVGLFIALIASALIKKWPRATGIYLIAMSLLAFGFIGGFALGAFLMLPAGILALVGNTKRKPVKAQSQ